MQRIDIEHRKLIAILRGDAPFEELITSNHEIEFAEALPIRAGDYLTIALGQNGPPGCLAIRKIQTDRQFEGEVFTTAEIGVGVIDIYSEEEGSLNGISTRICSGIGHLELA